MITQEKAITGIRMGKEVKLSLFADIIPVNSQKINVKQTSTVKEFSNMKDYKNQ